MEANKATTDVETGVETNNSRINTADWEVEAYADDGEHAMCWMVRRLNDTTIEVQNIACEAGLRDEYGEREVFTVSEDKGTVEFAREVSEADPIEAVELARKYWN